MPDTESRLVALSLSFIAFRVIEHQEDILRPTSGYSILINPHDSQKVLSGPLGGVLKELPWGDLPKFTFHSLDSNDKSQMDPNRTV